MFRRATTDPPWSNPWWRTPIPFLYRSIHYVGAGLGYLLEDGQPLDQLCHLRVNKHLKSEGYANCEVKLRFPFTICAIIAQNFIYCWKTYLSKLKIILLHGKTFFSSFSVVMNICRIIYKFCDHFAKSYRIDSNSCAFSQSLVFFGQNAIKLS